MLSRVANSLYWMSRYIERAENIARLVDVNLQLLLDFRSLDDHALDAHWIPIVQSSGDEELMEIAVVWVSASTLTVPMSRWAKRGAASASPRRKRKAFCMGVGQELMMKVRGRFLFYSRQPTHKVKANRFPSHFHDSL